MRRSDNGGKGLVWEKLPVLTSKQLGLKLGPAFGFGAGCGLGFGIGFLGGAGFGAGIPGIQFGFGFGVGCGVGVGFGYGLGRGVARDEHRRYSNVSGVTSYPTQDEIGALVDELVDNTKKVLRATSRELDKWRRS